MRTSLLGAAAMALLVAGCGTDPQERVTGGAAAGAATGAGVGALGGPVGALAGAAIGGGAGAVTGAVTEPDNVNLGRPVWENPDTRVPGVTSSSGSGSSAIGGGMGASSNRQAQQALNDRGYDAGPADGVWGPRSRSATMAFQRANGLEPTGQLTSGTLQALNVSGGTSRTSDQDRAYMGGGMVGQGGSGSGSATGTGAPGGMGSSTGGGSDMPPSTGTRPGMTPQSSSGSQGMGTDSTFGTGSGAPSANPPR